MATGELFSLVYEELRVLARRHLAAERPGHTLQATALVNEAYLRLIGPGDVSWQNRAHFFGAAALAIRRILIDHARARARRVQGQAAQRVPLNDELAVVESGCIDVLALDEALKRLAEIDEQSARVVELRFFAGLGTQEAAEVLGVSSRTVERDWDFARTWLHRAMNRE